MQRSIRCSHRLALSFLSVLCLLSTNLPAQTDPADAVALDDRKRALEERLSTLLRHLPTLDQTFIDRRQTVAEKELGVSFQVRHLPERERLLTEDGSPLPILTERSEIHGQHPMDSVRDWLEGVGGGYAIRWVEELTVRAGPEGTVDMTASVVTAGYTLEEPEEERSRAYLYMSRLERTEMLVSTIEALRERPGLRDLALILAIVDVAAVDQDSRWIELRYADGRLDLEGVVAGARAWDGLQQQLKEAGLKITARQHTEAGCHRVNLSAEVGKMPEDAWYSTQKKPSFHPDPWTACLAKPAGELHHLEPLRDTGGALSLHLRDLRAGDLFQMLHFLGGGNFIVDDDLPGRLSGDFVAVNEDSVIDALHSVPIHVTSGDLRRVSRTAVSVAGNESPAETQGEPISVVLRKASAAQMLCSLGRIEGREVWVPASLDRRVNMVAREVPSGLIFEGVLAAAGLRRDLQEDRWLISDQGVNDEVENVDACNLELGDFFPWFYQESNRLTVDDVRLAATGRHEEDWQAFAYAPGGRLMRLLIGSKLGEATVEAIDSDSVTLSTEAGEQHLSFSE